ncbi:MAG: signal peptidase I [Bacilli bacterium]|nr:signal peptidase I [Bacilli bacterium]
MTIDENSFFYKLQYYSYFVTRAFLLAVFGLLLLLAVFFAIYFGDLFLNVKTGNYNSPIFNGYVIVSQSMVPTININDAIVIKRDSHDGYQVGDIISFFSTEYDSEGMVVTHRIVKKDNLTTSNSTYRTKGDNNPVPDKRGVDTSNIYGKVFLIIPKLGYVQSFLSQPSHFIICILIPAGIVIIYDLFRIMKAFQKGREIY